MLWRWFAVRASLGNLDPRSTAEWERWAVPFHRQIAFRIKKRWRSTVRVRGRLDAAHRQARELLRHQWNPAESVHGFVKGRSTRTAAAPHAGAKVVLAVDLEDFYGQVTWGRLETDLNQVFDEDTCAWIQGTCFVDGVLPLGFRTSPVLSNRAFHTTDLALEALCDRFDVTYTRWVDDLMFSGDAVSDQFLVQVRSVLAAHNWVVNERKVRFMRRSPYVLGLYVGQDVDQPRLPRKMKKRLLLESYHFGRRGFEHFSTEGVMSPDRLFGQMTYAASIEPDLAEVLEHRMESGFTRSGYVFRRHG